MTRARAAAASAGLKDPRTWMLRSRAINKVVKAATQWEAWDTLKEHSVMDFGLIVTAEASENADPIAVHTETLMRRWNRPTDADAYHALAVEHGLLAG